MKKFELCKVSKTKITIKNKTYDAVHLSPVFTSNSEYNCIKESMRRNYETRIIEKGTPLIRIL